MTSNVERPSGGSPANPRDRKTSVHALHAWVVLNAEVALAYWAAAHLGHLLCAGFSGSPPPFWPALAVAILACWRWGARTLAGLTVGGFLSFYLSMGLGVGAAALGALAHSFAPWLVWTALRRLVPGRPALSTPGEVGLLLLVATASAVLGALAGLLTLPEWPLAWANPLRVWWDGFLGQAAGALLPLPAALVWWNRSDADARISAGESLALGGVAILLTGAVFLPEFQAPAPWVGVPFLACVPLGWLSLRGGRRMALTLVPLLALAAFAATWTGRGPFADIHPASAPWGTLWLCLVLSALWPAPAPVGQGKAATAAESSDAQLRALYQRTGEERDRLQAQLIQSQKMEAVGQLAGGVAHDFNNILTAVLMQISLLQADSQLTAALRAGLADLEAEARRAAELTRQLLLFSRRHALLTRTFDLTSLLGNLLKMLRRLVGERIRLELNGPAEPLPVEADAGMIEQVVMNLVVNARDALPQGGCITLTPGAAELDPADAQRNPEARPGRFVRLSVTDTGCGMDAHTLAHLFEPFFTTKQAGKGTGLGLATVYGIVKQHRGWIEVSSALGRGSTFSVYLPAGQARPSLPENPEEFKSMRGGHETVLLAEDENSVRQATARTLRQLGYRVIEATTSDELLEVWERERASVDLLITDNVMPGEKTGAEMAEHLRQREGDLKVLVMSGYSPEHLRGAAGEDRHVRFLAKPFTAAELAKSVREWLDSQ